MTPEDELAGGEMRCAGPRGHDAAAEVQAWRGGRTDDQSGVGTHFGDLEVGWVEGCGEDLDEDLVVFGRWGCAGGWFKVEVLFEAVCGVAVEPGFHCCRW